MKHKYFQHTAPWLLPILLLIGWQLCSSLQLISASLFPSPTKVVASGWKLIASGELGHHILVSLARSLVGLAIGGAIGFILGILNGLYKTSLQLTDTTLQMIRNVPHLALVPLLIVWLGIGESPKIFLVALGVLFPIYINTMHGIRTVDRGFIEMGRMYGLKGFQLFKQIMLPSALPSIFVGLRYALGIMWLTLIVSETIATNSGVGYLAMNAREFMQTDIIILSILLYALFGKLADWLTQWGERRALRWHPNYNQKP